MSSFCHLFWLRPLYSRTPLGSKVKKNLPFFIRSVQSAWEGAERSSVLSHFFAALCNVLAAPKLIEPKQLKLPLDLSTLHGRGATRVVLQSGFAQHFPMGSRIGSWTLNSASRTISYTISLSSLRLRPLYSRTPPDSKAFKFSLDQSNLHGKEQQVCAKSHQNTAGTQTDTTYPRAMRLKAPRGTVKHSYTQHLLKKEPY